MRHQLIAAYQGPPPMPLGADSPTPFLGPESSYESVLQLQWTLTSGEIDSQWALRRDNKQRLHIIPIGSRSNTIHIMEIPLAHGSRGAPSKFADDG